VDPPARMPRAGARGDRHQARCRHRRLDRGYPGGQGSILDRAGRNVFHRRGPSRKGESPPAAVAMLAAQMDGMRASLLHESVPATRRIAILTGRPPRHSEGA
jgi:hypothetical protein